MTWPFAFAVVGVCASFAGVAWACCWMAVRVQQSRVEAAELGVKLWEDSDD